MMSELDKPDEEGVEQDDESGSEEAEHWEWEDNAQQPGRRRDKGEVEQAVSHPGAFLPPRTLETEGGTEEAGHGLEESDLLVDPDGLERLGLEINH